MTPSCRRGNKANWQLQQMGGPTPGGLMPDDMHTRAPAALGPAMQVNGEWGVPIAGDVPSNRFTDM
jgi:hypothetical protein